MLATTSFEALYRRLSRGRRSLTALPAQVLGGGLGLLISLAAAWVALLPPYFQRQPSGFPMEWLYRLLPGVTSIASTLALPLFLAYVAAFVTVTYIRSKEYPLLLVTTIPNREIVEGFVLAVFNRCGALLALQAGVLPFIATAFITEPNSRYIGLYSGVLFGFELVEFGAVMQFVLALLAVGLLVSGLNGLVTSLAVMLSLWWRNTIAAASTAAIVVAALTAGALHYLSQLFGARTFETSLALYLAAALVSFSLMWLSMRLAERWVRR